MLYEISEQNKILKAKQFVQRHAERINSLILQAKTFGLDKTADDLRYTQAQLLEANTTDQIKQQFKIIIIHQQKVEQVKEISQAGLLRLQSLLVPLEKKAKVSLLISKKTTLQIFSSKRLLILLRRPSKT